MSKRKTRRGMFINWSAPRLNSLLPHAKAMVKYCFCRLSICLQGSGSPTWTYSNILRASALVPLPKNRVKSLSPSASSPQTWFIMVLANARMVCLLMKAFLFLFILQATLFFYIQFIDVDELLIWFELFVNIFTFMSLQVRIGNNGYRIGENVFSCKYAEIFRM